ncbi:SDR family oxidoreductase [Spongiibacter sp.]|uniref:SDR family oxidoreductase n=1 Tax=Spongiibacter sp. TaxID=2024860 RepID=UPI003561C2D6
MSGYLVTGSASGIGAAVCERLLDDGENVLGLDRQDADIVADLSTVSGRRGAVEQALEAFPEGLDGLVCCAGVGSTSATLSLIPEVNFFGSIELLEGLAGALQRRRGAAVLVSSNSAPQATDEAYLQALINGDREAVAARIAELSGHAAYCGSKQALARWMRQQAPAYARRGVRLNAVAPGYTRTAMTAETEQHPEYGDAIREFLATIPLGRAGEPSDVANAIGFLLSGEAGFVCGSLLYVDGGHDAMFRPDNI